MKLTVFLFCLLAAASAATAQPADLILRNVRVWAGDGRPPFAAEIAIRGDRIVAVGQGLGRRFAGSRTRTEDLGGRFVMPGINDAHIHFLSGALGMFQVDLTDAKSVADAQALIAKFARENPDAPWITGRGWQYTIFPGGLPHRRDIDAVVSDRPVYLRAYDGHTAWANSKALEISGVGSATEFSGFGEIVRDANGFPTGVLKEGAMGLVSRNVPAITRAQRLAALEKGFATAHALGITSIQNAHGSLSETELFEEFERAGKLKIRTSFAFSIGPETTEADIDRIAALRKRFDSPMLRVRAVKIMVDGVIESHTAAMLAPYTTKPDTSGTPNFTPDQLNRVVAIADRAGLQIYIHAIGDRGVRMALDAFENTIRLNGRRDSRHRIEHIETIDPADIPRFKRLGVIASMEPIHADPGTIDIWAAAIGKERASRGFAWRLLEQAGARLVFSSDYPAAISMSPWRGLHNAVNRQTIDGFPAGGWLPEHRVSVETALAAYTTGGAFASFEERVKGRIAPGMLADLIVLDRDPTAVPAAELFRIRVLRTYLGGREMPLPLPE